MRRRGAAVGAILAAAVAAAAPTLAGPPFLTDDPEPVELHHFEAYLFSTWDATGRATAVGGPAAELNVGAAPELQLHLVVPMATLAASGRPAAHGLGDVEIGVKYRLLGETATRPQVGVFPMLELPTGDPHRGLGNGRLWARLPVWAQKSWGPWTTYGGIGYAINHAPGARSSTFAGWLVQREVSRRLTLGAEVYAHTAEAEGGRSSAILDGGGFYALTPGFSLLFSAGRTVRGEPHTVAYLGAYWTWGR